MSIGSLYFSSFSPSAEGCGKRQATPESLLKAPGFCSLKDQRGLCILSCRNRNIYSPSKLGKLFRFQFPGGFFDQSSGLHRGKLCLVTRKLFSCL